MDIKLEMALIDFVKAKLGRPFAWGICDCNTLALEASDAVFGTEMAEKVVGQYDTPDSAEQYRKSSPWGSFINLIKENGFIEAQKGFEQTGDFLIVEDSRWEQVHICMGIRSVSCALDAVVHLFPTVQLKNMLYSVWRHHD